jgi:NAD(P)-dependent dehydrogenase (short-subunit alcohol dehydrogenase family)
MNLDDLQSLYDFSGRTVLITGGVSGLGTGIVRALMVCQTNIVIPNRDPEKAGKALDDFPIRHRNPLLSARVHSSGFT